MSRSAFRGVGFSPQRRLQPAYRGILNAPQRPAPYGRGSVSGLFVNRYSQSRDHRERATAFQESVRA
jgi:hypothetical protein